MRNKSEKELALEASLKGLQPPAVSTDWPTIRHLEKVTASVIEENRVLNDKMLAIVKRSNRLSDRAKRQGDGLIDALLSAGAAAWLGSTAYSQACKTSLESLKGKDEHGEE